MADTITADQANKLAELGWIKPELAQQFQQSPTMSPEPVAPNSSVQPAEAVSSVPPVPQAPPPPPNLAHAAPTQGLGAPVAVPDASQTIAQANGVQAPPQVAPSPAPTSQPNAPRAAPGKLLGDNSQQPQVGQSVPAPAAPPAVKGGPGTAAPRGPTATDTWLKSLKEEQTAQANRAQKVDDAVAARADAENAKSVAQTAGAYKAADDAKAALDQSMEHRRQAMQEADAADAESRKRAQEVAAMKVDPNRLWNKASTGQKIVGGIFAGLGLALGGIGAGMTKGPNYAMEIIQSAINRDIDAQKEEIQNAKDGAAELAKISKAKYGREMDMAEFETRSRMDAYNYALAQVDAVAKSHDTGINTANADLLRQQLAGEAGQQKLGLAQQVYGVNRAKEQAAAAAGNAAAAQAKENQKQFRELTAKFMENGDDLHTAQARALGVMAPQLQKDNIAPLAGKPTHSKSGEDKAQPQKDARTEVLGAVQELRQLNQDAGMTGLWSPEKKARADALRATIMQKLPLADVGSKKPPSESDMAILEKRLPDLKHPGSEAARSAAYDVLEKSLKGPVAPGGDEDDVGFKAESEEK